VRDVSIVEPADEVEFDVIITEVIEQPPAASEEDLNQVDLRLVDLPGAQKRLGGPRPVDHDRPRSPAAARAWRAQSSTSVTKRAWPGGTSPSSTWCESTKIGTPS
jgi:hypothetical protein